MNGDRKNKALDVVAIVPGRTSATILEEKVKEILTLPMKDRPAGVLKSLENVTDTNITVAEAVVVAQVRKALSGDTKAFEALMKAGLLDKALANVNAPQDLGGSGRPKTLLEYYEEQLAREEMEAAMEEEIKKALEDEAKGYEEMTKDD